MKVKLRTQEQKGRIYFYTDIFYGYVIDKDGKKKPKRKRKSLELSYPVNCTNPFDRKQKKEAIRLANLKVLKLETEFHSDKAGLGKSYMSETNFFEFFENHLNNTKMTMNNRNGYENVISKLIAYRGRYTLINQVDYEYCKGFGQFLVNGTKKDGNPLSSSTIDSYYKKLTIICKELVSQGILKKNPAIAVKLPKVTHKRKEVLSKEEIKLLMDVDCKIKVLKQYFIFSIFTGIDNATCQELRWKNYVVEDGIHKLKFTRTKTNHSYGFPLSENAVDWLNKFNRKSDDDKIFIGLTYGGHQNNMLLFWLKDVGIKKHITPHCARHTFAYHYYKKTKDLFTVMNIMAHKDVSTTQRYLRSLFNDYGDNFDAMTEYDALNSMNIL
jgi:site-specific recombinase XerC